CLAASRRFPRVRPLWAIIYLYAFTAWNRLKTRGLCVMTLSERRFSRAGSAEHPWFSAIPARERVHILESSIVGPKSGTRHMRGMMRKQWISVAQLKGSLRRFRARVKAV